MAIQNTAPQPFTSVAKPQGTAIGVTTAVPAPAAAQPAPQQPTPSVQTAPAQVSSPAAPQPVVHSTPTYEIPPNPDRRDDAQASQRLLGHLVSIDGGFATLATTASEMSGANADFWSIGRLISIATPESRIVGLVFKTDIVEGSWKPGQINNMTVSIELVGEIRDDATGEPVFSRGITSYPALGSVAHRIRSTDLEVIHQPKGGQPVQIGQLSQDENIPAVVCIDDMIKRHFAIVGTTGTGKSTSVSLLLRKIVENRPNLRVLILDPHNEYATAFPNQTNTISTDTLELPFWLFQQEEMVEVIFRGRDGVEEEIDTLRDLIPMAKTRFSQKFTPAASTSLRRSQAPVITADTPVPYRMTDLFALIDEEIGQLEGRYDRSVLKSLKSRLESLVADPRYRFMFVQRTVADNMAEIIGHIFRVPINNKPITAFQLTGLPSEVVNSVVSVLCRMAFDLAVWSKGSCEVLVLAEEAHRYVPLDRNQGFGPTRRSIARIAKEGRKYGCYLGVVTQRPGELDPTILSQCSTVFAMRLANDHDQDIIRSAISDSSASTISFLSSIGNQEAIAFGEGIATPMRMRFEHQPPAFIPGAPNTTDQGIITDTAPIGIETIVTAMRNMHDRG
jgi:DNA helicase HerA-like ATPase